MMKQAMLCKDENSGNLVIEHSWPSQIRSVYGDHERMISTYFSMYKDIYFTGDGARRDKDGYFWITGRVDDVLNVSGHRLGTAEIESALVLHPKIAEAAVVGFDHPIKGQGIYAYITLMIGESFPEDFENDVKMFVAKEIGAIAKPDLIQNAPGLPKTRSGKIMRRILRKIAEGDLTNLGDTTTLADPTVVESLIENRQSLMKKISIFFIILLVQGCLISPKELEELNADNNFYSPAQTIKCMQMPSPQRPTPINKREKQEKVMTKVIVMMICLQKTKDI